MNEEIRQKNITRVSSKVSQHVDPCLASVLLALKSHLSGKSKFNMVSSNHPDLFVFLFVCFLVGQFVCLFVCLLFDSDRAAQNLLPRQDDLFS